MISFYKILLLAVSCLPVSFPTVWAAEGSSKSPTIIYAPDSAPYYPSYSRRNGEKGTVKIRIVVGVEGTVTNAVLVKSSGYERLDEAAQKIGSRYRFTPLYIDGKPHPHATDLLIRFGISDE